MLDIILYEHKNHEQDKVEYPRLAHNDAIFYNKNNALYVKEDFGSYGAIYHIIYKNRNNANKHWLNFYDINLFFLLYKNQTLRNELTLCIGNIQNLEYIDVLSFYFGILGNIQFIYEQKPFAEFLMTKIAHINKLCLIKAYKICKNNQPLSTSTIDSYVLSLTIAKYLKDKFVIFINHIDQYFLQHNNSYKYGIRSYSVGKIKYETLMCASNNVKAHIESETRS